MTLSHELGLNVAKKKIFEKNNNFLRYYFAGAYFVGFAKLYFTGFEHSDSENN